LSKAWDNSEKGKAYRRNYMRAYYHKRKHEERTLLGRQSCFHTCKGLPAPTRAVPTHCESCGRLPSGRSNQLVLDHDHKTGAFRGWLCDPCNLSIGQLGDTIESLESALAYLRRAQAQ
jgi:hypothetical protein